MNVSPAPQHTHRMSWRTRDRGPAHWGQGLVWNSNHLCKHKMTQLLFIVWCSGVLFTTQFVSAHFPLFQAGWGIHTLERVVQDSALRQGRERNLLGFLGSCACPGSLSYSAPLLFRYELVNNLVIPSVVLFSQQHVIFQQNIHLFSGTAMGFVLGQGGGKPVLAFIELVWLSPVT